MVISDKENPQCSLLGFDLETISLSGARSERLSFPSFGRQLRLPLFPVSCFGVIWVGTLASSRRQCVRQTIARLHLWLWMTPLWFQGRPTGQTSRDNGVMVHP